ncbi:MAG: hypothetical protein H6834_06765 [Planctomycetes bacterium]|nr:hypothetical protein [Planctomycetota bacterium]
MSAKGMRARVRQWMRGKLGRTRLERIERQLAETHHLLQGTLLTRLQELEDRFGKSEARVADVNAGVGEVSERLERVIEERRQLSQHLLDAVGRIEQDRIEVASNLERFREVLEEGPRVLATLDNRILRYCEITDRVDDGLGRLHTAIRDLSAHVERRHEEWLGGLQGVRTELDRASEFAKLSAEREEQSKKVRALADQCAHVIDVLGQTRKQMHEMREKADLVDETRAEKSVLERDLATSRSEIDEVREDLREALRAAETLERLRDSMQLELDRVKAQRDRLVTGSDVVQRMDAEVEGA